MDFVKSLHAITTLFHGTLDNFEVKTPVPQIDFCFTETTSSLVPNGCFKVVKSYWVVRSHMTKQPRVPRTLLNWYFSYRNHDRWVSLPSVSLFPVHYEHFMNILNFKITLISKVTDAILIVIIGRWLGPTYLLCCRLLFSSKATVVLCWICLGAKEVQKLKKKNLLE